MWSALLNTWQEDLRLEKGQGRSTPSDGWFRYEVLEKGTEVFLHTNNDKFSPNLAHNCKGWKRKILLMLSYVSLSVWNKSVNYQNIQNRMSKYVITKWNRKMKDELGLKLSAFYLLFSTANDMKQFWSKNPHSYYETKQNEKISYTQMLI